MAAANLYVADTNNHKIRVIDLKSGAVRTLKIEGLGPVQAEGKLSAANASQDRFAD